VGYIITNYHSNALNWSFQLQILGRVSGVAALISKKKTRTHLGGWGGGRSWNLTVKCWSEDTATVTHKVTVTVTHKFTTVPSRSCLTTKRTMGGGYLVVPSGVLWFLRGEVTSFQVCRLAHSMHHWHHRPLSNERVRERTAYLPLHTQESSWQKAQS